MHLAVVKSRIYQISKRIVGSHLYPPYTPFTTYTVPKASHNDSSSAEMPPAETPSKAVAQLLFMMKLGSSSGLGDAALEPRVQEAGGSAKRPPRRGKTSAGMKVERVAGNDSGAQRHSQGYVPLATLC